MVRKKDEKKMKYLKIYEKFIHLCKIFRENPYRMLRIFSQFFRKHFVYLQPKFHRNILSVNKDRFDYLSDLPATPLKIFTEEFSYQLLRQRL